MPRKAGKMMKSNEWLPPYQGHTHVSKSRVSEEEGVWQYIVTKTRSSDNEVYRGTSSTVASDSVPRIPISPDAIQPKHSGTRQQRSCRTSGLDCNPQLVIKGHRWHLHQTRFYATRAHCLLARFDRFYRFVWLVITTWITGHADTYSSPAAEGPPLHLA